MKCARACTDPLSSISLPNSAPSKNIGKNCATNCAALPMNVCVQWASRGSPANAAAMIATAGARSSTLQPRNESQMRRPRATRIPTRPMASKLLQEDSQIERRAPADVLPLPGRPTGVDGDEKRVLRVAVAYERHDRRVGGVTAIPIRLATDLDRVEASRQGGGRKQDIGRKLGVAKQAPAAGVNVGRRHEQQDWRSPTAQSRRTWQGTWRRGLAPAKFRS